MVGLTLWGFFSAVVLTAIALSCSILYAERRVWWPAFRWRSLVGAGPLWRSGQTGQNGGQGDAQRADKTGRPAKAPENLLENDMQDPDGQDEVVLSASMRAARAAALHGFKDVLHRSDAFRLGGRGAIGEDHEMTEKKDKPASSDWRAASQSSEQDADDWFAAFAARRAEIRRALDGVDLPVRNRFQVTFPQRPTGSWLGGCPMLEPGLSWPVVDGQAARFMAQIDLDSLEPEVWAGLGSRDEALAFFKVAEDRPIVLPARRKGEYSLPPEGYAVADHWHLACTRDLPGRPPVDKPSLEAVLAQGTVSEQGFYPFDWPLALMLLNEADSGLTAKLRHWEAKDGSDAPEQIEARRMSLARLRLLRRHAHARSESVPFSLEERDQLLHALSGLIGPDWGQRAGSGEVIPGSLLQFPFFAGYKAQLESRSRRLFARDPEALPRVTRDRLLPLWVEVAEAESLHAGNPHTPDGATQWPVLLDLPLGRFAGEPQSAESRWVVSLPHEDLAKGQFQHAESEIIEVGESAFEEATPNTAALRTASG